MKKLLGNIVESFYRFAFMVLLNLLGWKISRKRKRGQSAKLEALLKDKRGVLQFQTKDGRSVNHFVVADSTVSVFGGGHQLPSITVNFISARFAIKTLTAGDVNAFLKAIQDKRIEISGDYSLLMWFMSLVKSALK